MPCGRPLSIPNVEPGTDTLTAALAYAAAGWFLAPIRPGTKDPGSRLGKGWQAKTVRDAESVTAHWAGCSDGIAIHCGRSGAIVFDVDHPDKVPAVLAAHLPTAPYQSTRPGTADRGHYLFAVPPGRQFGNGTGKLCGDWGEVRGQNGVVLVAPSDHPDGGEYRWQRNGTLPVLPDEIADLLPNAELVDADAATDQQMAAFLAEHTKSARPELLGAVINRWHERMAAGESRHNTAVTLMCWAMDEAAAGIYPAAEAERKLRDLFMVAKTDPSHPGATLTAQQARHAWDGITAWAIGRAGAKSTERQAERAANANNLPTLDSLAGTGRQAGSVAHSPATAAPAALAAGSRWQVRTLDTIDTAVPEWAWEYDGRGRILKGGLTLFVGRPAAGKSTAARWFAAGWTTGTLSGCWEGKPINVLYVAGEESWRHVVAPSLQAAGADPKRLVRLESDGDPARITAGADKADILAVCADNEIRAVILDPLMSTLGAGPDLYRSNEVREALTPWAEIAEAIDGVVLGIGHLTKAARDVTAGINGSSAFGEVARCVFGFAVDREAEDGTRVMTQSKNSSGVDGLNLAYRIGQQHVAVSDGRTADMGRFELIGATDRTVRDLLADEQATGRESAVSECARWLKGFLSAKGQTPSLEVRAEGAGFGFSERTIQRAARKLDIQVERTREVPPKTLWALPPSANTEAAA